MFTDTIIDSTVTTTVAWGDVFLILGIPEYTIQDGHPIFNQEDEKPEDSESWLYRSGLATV